MIKGDQGVRALDDKKTACRIPGLAPHADSGIEKAKRCSEFVKIPINFNLSVR